MSRRLGAVGLAGVVPWVVVLGAGSDPTVSLVFAFGLVTPTPLHVTTLPAYLLVHTGGLPPSLLAWPVAALLYAAAVASLVGGRSVDREDRRLTAGLLVLSGLSLLAVVGAVGRPPNAVAIPTGTAVLWAVAWWADAGALRSIVGGPAGGER